MTPPKTIVWTKSADANDLTLWANHKDVLFSPLIALDDLKLPEWPGQNLDIVIASRYAAQKISHRAHPWRKQLLQSTIHTFGPVTTKILTEAELQVIRKDNCLSLYALYRILLANRDLRGLHFIGARKSSANPLSIRDDFIFKHSAIYENRVLDQRQQWAEVSSQSKKLVCVASASAARNALDHINDLKWTGVEFACIGQQSTAPIKNHPVLICEQPKIEDLVQLAKEWYKKV
ncbi:uroporphyrinogen-III synthase [Oligoflexaceae bacterium]|nr:uroporphyrinogen-III synthase [Oligoflexaceae bacterium]